MGVKFLHNINLSDNQLTNAKLHVTATAPTAAEGQVYFNSTTGVKMGEFFNGTNWVKFPREVKLTTYAGTPPVGTTTNIFDVNNGALTVNQNVDHFDITAPSPGELYFELADTVKIVNLNVTGTGTSATFDNDVRIKGTLSMQTAGGTNGAITNVVDPTNAQDVATKNYVDTIASGGVTFKGTFRADTGEILSGANNGSYLYQVASGSGAFDPSLSRVAIDTGDYYLVASAAGNFYGIGGTGSCGTTQYLDIGDSVIAVSDAAANASVCSDWSIVQSDEGVVSISASTAPARKGISVSANTGSVNVGLDIANLPFITGGTLVGVDSSSISVPIYNTDTASPSQNEYIELSQIFSSRSRNVLIGDGSTTSFVLQNSGATAPNKNHELGTQSDFFMVQLVEISSGETVHAEVTRGANGNVTIAFAVAPASNGIRVLIHNT
jgi:hypothetical protein